LPKVLNLNLIMRKLFNNSESRTFYKTSGLTLKNVNVVNEK
jgi:hypothetical protein